MARRLPFSVVFFALVVALASQPAAVLAAQDAPPIRALQAQPLDATDTYIITLEHPALARYRGGIDNLAPTSNELTGAAKLDVNSAASQAYLAFLAERRGEFLQRVSERLGRQVEIGHIYDVVLNGLTLKLTPTEAAQLAGLPGLLRISPREKRQLLTDRGPQWIGAPAAWGSASDCTGGNCGEGIVMGVVDTGINMNHPSFADIGGDGFNHTNPLGSGNYKGWCNPTHPNHDAALVCNDKLIGVYSYPASGMDPEDPEGHGSHTASTAAGNRLYNVLLDEPTIDFTFDISGVAPHANIIAYDACEVDGCNTDDLVAALNQAAIDSVDALNYSISGSGLSPWVAEDEQAFLGLREAGAFVSASAGNSGPGPATVAHGSPWVVTTAASTHDRALVNALINLTSSNGPLPDIYGRSVTGPLSTAAPIVIAANVNNNPLCLPSIWGANAVSGKIVVCDRGNNARVDKAINVQAAGGVGMVLVNAAANGDEEIGDAYVIPGVHITYNEGVTLKNWLAAGSNHTGAILGTQNDIQDNNGDVMAAFSSRGPNNQVPDLIKPDMTAPGVDILAAWATIAGEPVPELEIISGTSMSSPHMAGAGALMMKAKYNGGAGWTVAEIQSAMMTTSVWDNTVRKEDTATPSDPFDRGSGRVNVANALNAGLLLNITSAQYDAANPATGGDPKTLNYPSMADDACYKTCGWTRTVRNPTGQSMTWNGTFVGQNGLQGTLSAPSFTVGGGATQSFTLTINDVTGLTPGQWYFGHVVYTEDTGDAPQFHMPVAIRVAGSTDASVITKTVTPTGAGAGAQLTYTVTVKNKVKSARTFAVSDVVPAGSAFVAGSQTGGWTYNSGANTLSGNVNLGAATFVWREKTLGGYQGMAGNVPPADLTGVALDNGCFTLGGMDFYYLDQHYTDVVISMNGVVRAGIGAGLCPSGTPNNFPTNDPSDFQDNLLGPFWADLDLTGGNMYLVLTIHNGKPHTVIEWEDVRLKATNQRVSFQIWFEDGTDNIWFAYEPGFNTMLGTATPTATIGAENLAGNEGVMYYRFSGSGSPSGTVPTGAVDVWVGLEATTATLGFKANATAGANTTIVNEATTTVSSTTNRAWASTRVCGPATAAQPRIAIQGQHFTLTDWAGSPWDSFELWRATSPYLAPGAGDSTKVFSGKNMSFVDLPAPVVGDPAVNHFYNLRTINCAGSSQADSGWVGEFDFALVAGQ